MNRSILSIALAAAALASGFQALAQSDAPVVVQRRTTGFVLKEGDHDIEDLVDRAARFLGRNILLAPAELQANTDRTVVLQKAMELDATGCEDIVSQLLYSKGFLIQALDEKKGLYEVLSLQSSRAAMYLRPVPRSAEEILSRPEWVELVLVTLEFVHAYAQYMYQSLSPFYAQGGRDLGSITMAPVHSSAMTVMGLRPKVAAAIRQLRAADKAAEKQNEPLYQQIQNLQQRVAALERAAKK